MREVSPGVLELLTRDVVATVGERHRSLVGDAAAAVGVLEIDDLDNKLVEDVQQALMDTFVDTCWPECPRHGSHPLWYRAGGWWCEKDRAEVCRLGALKGATPIT